MSIASDLRTYLLADATLTTLVGTRMYPLKLPQAPTMPAIIYTWISGARVHSTDGPSGLSNPRVQFDCWAQTYLEAEALLEALRKRLDGFQGTAGSSWIQAVFFETERDGYDDDTELYRRSADFFVWYEEAVS
jgi:hypothetical protein